MTRYGMVIDTRRCIACNTCSMVCRVEHNLPNGMMWNEAHTTGGEVDLTPGGTYPDGLTMGFYTIACQHCDAPACVEVCPTGATAKRDDGIVTVDWDECIGCQSCVSACPYDVRRFVDGEPQWHLDFATGDQTLPEHRANVVEKCTFCVERIDRGERPACVDVCRNYARYFGDLDDPSSEVCKAMEGREVEQLLADKGTGPCVYFLK